MSISLEPSDVVARAQDFEVTVVQKRAASKGKTKERLRDAPPIPRGLT
jgi:hypothetical protein